MAHTKLADIDFKQYLQSSPFPSPVAWEDQVFYFLLVDRFSNAQEAGYLDVAGNVVNGSIPLFSSNDDGNAVKADAEKWRNSGGGWVGGTIKGVTSKIGYLKRLGITALWVSPVMKQVEGEETYHGYGIQSFLDVDPHFGTAADFKELVQVAHTNKIYVVLDVIVNHTGNVFEYDPDRYPEKTEDGKPFMDPRWDGRPYAVKGFRGEHGQPTISFTPAATQAVEDAKISIVPRELFQPATFTAKGRISNWKSDYEPEFLEGDFWSLKNVQLGYGSLEAYQPSPALQTITRSYQYWIAEFDIDGFRLDTVKHMDLGATRYFASAIHEYAMSLGKDNFYLLGEIAGGRDRAYTTLQLTGVDAALGIDDIPDKLEYLVKGWRRPEEYFDLFRNSELVNKDSHIWFRNKIVTVYDDHDQVRKDNNKARFCADGDGPKLALAVMALNVASLGIPCIYYGSEQGLDGAGGKDRYIREAMFGGEFGAFRSHNRHVFNENYHLYAELAKILKLRGQAKFRSLRRGRQYLRQISGDGVSFGYPQGFGGRMLSVVPWSRILADVETVCAINTDPDDDQTAWITIDASLHKAGEALTCQYHPDDTQRNTLATIESRNGLSIKVTVPKGGFVMYQ
jgi:glycosidase